MEGNLKLDESRISNPKSRNLKLGAVRGHQSILRFRDFGFEILDSSNFKIPLKPCLAGFLILLALIALAQTPAHAQCALCVTALENSPEGRGMAGSFNRGILFLLAAPYAILGTVGIAVFRAYRKKKLDAQRDNPYIPKN